MNLFHQNICTRMKMCAFVISFVGQNHRRENDYMLCGYLWTTYVLVRIPLFWYRPMALRHRIGNQIPTIRGLISKTRGRSIDALTQPCFPESGILNYKAAKTAEFELILFFSFVLGKCVNIAHHISHTRMCHHETCKF